MALIYVCLFERLIARSLSALLLGHSPRSPEPVTSTMAGSASLRGIAFYLPPVYRILALGGRLQLIIINDDDSTASRCARGRRLFKKTVRVRRSRHLQNTRVKSLKDSDSDPLKTKSNLYICKTRTEFVFAFIKIHICDCTEYPFIRLIQEIII